MQVESSSLLELGKRESNTLITYPEDENNPEKFGIILDSSIAAQVAILKVPALQEGSMAYQLVGEVKAHQGNDE